MLQYSGKTHQSQPRGPEIQGLDNPEVGCQAVCQAGKPQNVVFNFWLVPASRNMSWSSVSITDVAEKRKMCQIYPMQSNRNLSGPRC